MSRIEAGPQTFPSQEVIDRIKRIGIVKVNLTPTEVIGMSAEGLARHVAGQLGGRLVMDVGKASAAERAIIRQAAGMPGIEATILGDNGGELDAEGFAEVDQILRAINREALGNGNARTIGGIAFGRFTKAVFSPRNHKLIEDEWNLYIVGHPDTSKVDSPYETHHLPNVSLKRRSEGEDPLREQVVDFVGRTMTGVRGKLEALLTTGKLLEHASAAMNEIDNVLLAVGMAEWSNFVRGGVYYRYLGKVGNYQPRLLAVQAIDKVNAQFNSSR